MKLLSNLSPPKLRPKKCSISSENILLICTVVSVVLAIIVGVCSRPEISGAAPLTPRELSYLKFPGEIFMRMLKCLILPLIVSSLICSLANLDTKSAGKLGGYTIAFYMATTLFAVILGIILVVVIRPGHRVSSTVKSPGSAKGCEGAAPGDTILDLIRNMFPNNIVAATFQSTSTCFDYQFNNVSDDGNRTEIMVSYKMAQKLIEDGYKDSVVVKPRSSYKMGMNILGLVVFSIIFGALLGNYKEKCETVISFFNGLEFIIMKMVSLVIWISPIGIFFLIVAQLLQMKDLVDEMQRLSWYMGTVLIGLFVHALITLPILYFALTRKNPLLYCKGMVQALLTAFGTASSSATLPVTLKCLEENNGINPKVARFMVPLGATINMDGTALYEAIAAVYIGQSLGVGLHFGQIVIICLTATLASIGAAGIPQAGLVTMIMVLISVGLPPEMFVLILPVDWFLDRIRTMINVWGDSVGAGAVNHLIRNQLIEIDVDKNGYSYTEELPMRITSPESDTIRAKL